VDWLKRILGRAVLPAAPTTVNGFPAPWVDDRPSLFGYLVSFPLEADGRLPQAASTLPDEEALVSRSGSQLRWAAGAADGVLGRHVQAPQPLSVDKALHMLQAASASTSPEHVKAFYDLVNEGDVLRLADALLDAVRASTGPDTDRLHAFAQWLARESPDRAPVKMGIALLGLFSPPQDTDMLLRLGLHDEFTLYAAVALGNSLPQAQGEDALWSLAQRVDGWGRIHLVERLARSSRPDIKAWLLREGYKNSVMYEYLAYACATGGGLLQALQEKHVDAALLDGAGELIQALLQGGPAEDIGVYDDGAYVVQHYLAHSAVRAAPPLTTYLAVSDIVEFLDDGNRTWASLETKGWTPDHRRLLREAAGSILSGLYWPSLALAALDDKDRVAFWVASTAAERMGLDTWEKHFARQRDGVSEQWHALMRTRDPARVERVIALAQSQLNLRAIAIGPSNATGLGAEYRQHGALDFILQSLGEFPGQGWPLVRAGLRSPVTRNRNMALRTLGAWGRAQWPEDAQTLLLQALREEPDDQVRSRMEQLLAT
jgi:hypothetical protein